MIPPIFVDEHIGRQARASLEELGFQVKTHEDAGLPRGCRDTEWIPVVAERGWAALTGDIGQTRRKSEIEAIQKGGLQHFQIRARKINGPELAALLRRYCGIVKVALSYLPRPFSVSLLRDHHEIRTWYEDVDAVLSRYVLVDREASTEVN